MSNSRRNQSLTKKMAHLWIALCSLFLSATPAAIAQNIATSTRFLTVETFNQQPGLRLQEVDHGTGTLRTIRTYPGFVFATPPAANEPPAAMVGGNGSWTGKIAIQHYNWGKNSNYIIDVATGNMTAPLPLGYISSSIPAGFLSPLDENILISFHRGFTTTGLPAGQLANIDVFDLTSRTKIGSLATPIRLTAVLNHSLTWNGLTGDIFYRDSGALRRYNIFSGTTNTVRQTSTYHYPALPQVDLLTGEVIAIDQSTSGLTVKALDPKGLTAPKELFHLPSGHSIHGNVASIKGDYYKFIEAYSNPNNSALRVIHLRDATQSFSIPIPASITANSALKFID